MGSLQDEQTININESENCIASQVTQVIRMHGKNTYPAFNDVAEKLNVSPFKLRKLLEKNEISFQETKDNIRKETAIHYLSKTHLKIQQICLIVGFSDTSAFHRAFKSWTGYSPDKYRQLF